MASMVTHEEFIHALLVLEMARDGVETTGEEYETVRDAHEVLRKYRDALM